MKRTRKSPKSRFASKRKKSRGQQRFELLEPRLTLDSTVVINEIMYHPDASPEANYEWIELYNQMAIPMDISGWKLQGAVDYTFAPGTVMAGRSYLVIASNPSALAASTGYSGALGSLTRRLSNSGDDIQLVNNSGRLMSNVEYADADPWPVGADGSGFSLAKIDPYSNSSEAESWTVSRQLHGTPGAANFPSGVGAHPGVVFNEIGAAGGGFFVEIVNQGTTAYQLQGASIRTSAGSGATYTFTSPQLLAPGQHLSLTQAQLGFGGADGDKLFFYSAGQDRLLDARIVSNRLQGLAPGHGSRWMYPSVATPGAANSFNLNDQVVINEIMYNAMPNYPTSPTYQTSTLLAIDASTTWRYNQSGANLGANWAQTAHSGAGWQTGAGLFTRNTISPPLPSRTTLTATRVTNYFETEFTFSGNLNDLASLMLNYVVDDGAVFYLNGVEVLRVNMPTGTITSSTLASSNVGTAAYVKSILISPNSLVVGANRLSVEVHQASSSAFGDVVFGAEVVATTQVTPAGTPFASSPEEWIELYNRGTTSVDLSGWTFTDGITYTFAPGTTIAAGGYLVVAKNAAALQAKYPWLTTIVGNFSGSLSNSSDHLLLLDANGNVADEVTYYDEGYWPKLADGGGSSLELRDPDSDNSKAQAWAASNERDKGTWDTYTITLVAAADTGPVGVWNEFLFGMLQAGEVLLDDVSVIVNPGTASAMELIQNGTFQSDALNSEPAKWRIIGNHHGTVITDPDDPQNKVLRLLATGVTKQEGNNAGTTFVGNTAVVNGATYQITFRARWVGGSPQMNARAYLSRFSETFVLRTPTYTGTPGAQNSTYEANIGPTYSDLQHGPVVPEPGQPVTVRVRASDPDGIASMTLYWSVDGGAWNSVSMTLGTDGFYRANLPGQAAGKIVQFYVRGVDSLGASSTFPAAGANSRALYQVNDGIGPATAIDSIRLIMLTAEANHLLDPSNLMSNQDVGATIIYNNSYVFYDVGARLKGSSYSRGDDRWYGSYAIEMHPDQLFRGVHQTIDLDSTGNGAGSSANHEQVQLLMLQINNHAGLGLASGYEDLVHVVGPNYQYVGTAALQLARYDDEFLDETFADGSDGNVYEYELIYYTNKTVDGTVEGPKDEHGTGYVSTPLRDLGDDKDNYRWNSQLKNNRNADDFTRIMEMNKAFSLTGTAFLEAISSIIDVDQWLRTFAAATAMGVTDTMATGGNQHNIAFYVRPEDNKVLMFPWDWDGPFRLSRTSTITPGSSSLPLRKLIESPHNAHNYYANLWDIVTYTANSDYMSDFVNAISALSQQDLTNNLSYMDDRRASVLDQLDGVAPQTPFAITTNGGNNFSVTTPTVTLSGNGWFNVYEIRLAGSGQVIPVTWVTPTQWQITVPLASQGANHLTLEAYDMRGNLSGTSSITVTTTASTAQPKDWLRITELMYHPAPDGNEQYEFLEFLNTGTETLDLSGVRFTSGITFTFADGTTLAPGAYLIIVNDANAIISRYGNDVPIGGVFTGNFSNSGERLTLVDANNQIIQDFEYADSNPWYKAQVDGGGHSLVIVDPLGSLDAWGTPSGWRPSTEVNGSPGRVDPSYVASQYVFYNRSAFDGNDAAAGASDDAAIATDKTALLPGQTATFANYTSYLHGINGIMIDLVGQHGTLALDDFVFKVGNSHDTGSWLDAPLPIGLEVRSLSAGRDRVTFIWGDGVIKNQWLQITVKANANTGLTTEHTFYFGNQVGEVGNLPGNTAVDVIDVTSVIANITGFSTAAINNAYDINRDGKVDSLDFSQTLSNTTGFTSLVLLTAPPPAPAAGPEAALIDQLLGDDESDLGFAGFDFDGEVSYTLTPVSAPHEPVDDLILVEDEPAAVAVATAPEVKRSARQQTSVKTYRQVSRTTTTSSQTSSRVKSLQELFAELGAWGSDGWFGSSSQSKKRAAESRPFFYR